MGERHLKCEKTTLENPFGNPIFHISETDSTMNEARLLSVKDFGDGTTVYADFQSSGRGRIEGRVWDSSRGENLLCTTILKRSPVPGFTVRVGLAVALTFDSFLPMHTHTHIKWPNDVLFEGKKLAGILCENDGRILYIGTGLNIAQLTFPRELAEKATSLAAIIRAPLPSIEEVLVRYLENLKNVLEMDNWNNLITDKLFRRAEQICFLSGDPQKSEILDGILEGIGLEGELLFRPANPASSATPGSDGLLHLFSGEIPYT